MLHNMAPAHTGDTQCAECRYDLPIARKEIERLQQENDHLSSVLKAVADLLAVNSTPGNVARAIQFIRGELAKEGETHHV